MRGRLKKILPSCIVSAFSDLLISEKGRSRRGSDAKQQKRYPLRNSLVFQGTSPIMPIRGNNANQKWSRIEEADKSDSTGERVVMVTTSGTRRRRAPPKAPPTAANKAKQTDGAGSSISGCTLSLFAKKLFPSTGPCKE